jgi:ribosomal protein S27AE
MSKMIMEGCQGKPQLQVFEKTCPNCGAEIEIFSVDTEATCEKCGFTIYNDTLNCVQWCKYARQCVGDKMYEQMMKIAERQKAAKASKGEQK